MSELKNKLRKIYSDNKTIKKEVKNSLTSKESLLEDKYTFKSSKQIYNTEKKKFKNQFKKNNFSGLKKNSKFEKNLLQRKGSLILTSFNRVNGNKYSSLVTKNTGQNQINNYKSSEIVKDLENSQTFFHKTRESNSQTDRAKGSPSSYYKKYDKSKVNTRAKENLLIRKNLIDFNEFDKSYSKVEKAKEAFTYSKKKYKLRKKEFNKNSPSILKKNGKFIIDSGNISSTFLIEKPLMEDDDLRNYNDAKIKYYETKYFINNSKNTIKNTYKLAKSGGNLVLSGSDRSVNMLKGRGFTRTPYQLRWTSRLKNSLYSNQRFLKIRKAVKRTIKISRPFYTITRFIVTRNPFILGWLFLLLLITTIFSSIGSMSAPTSIKEREMTEAWIYLSKIDKEKSNDSIEYYSPLDEYLNYTDFRYKQTFDTLSNNLFDELERKGIANIPAGQKWLTGLWNQLNKDPSNLKELDDLIKSNNKDYNLSKKDQKTFEQLNKIKEEAGMRFPALQELDNFYYLKNHDKYDSPLVVKERFGYVDKKKLSDKTIFVAEEGQKLYAPLSGLVSNIDGKNITIEMSKRRITFYNVKNIKIKKGDVINKGDLMGQTSEASQEVKYEKYLKKKVDDIDYALDAALGVGTYVSDKAKDIVDFLNPFDSKEEEQAKAEEKEKTRKARDELLKARKANRYEWIPVNVGFYLKNVEYLQKTQSLVFEADGDKTGRIAQFKNIVKKHIPEATDQGIAAMLGNFDIESGIEPKRAEGDYLAPPVGKSSDKDYDRDEWLDINGPAIYGGRFPNILRRGLGLGQWTDTADGSVRQTELRKYAKKKNKKWYDLELQIDFAINGDHPVYRQRFRDVATSKDSVENLTLRFLQLWEGNPGDKIVARTNSARNILNMMKSGALVGGKFSVINGDFAHVFSVPYTVAQPWGKTPFSQLRGDIYPMGRHSGLDLQGDGAGSRDVTIHTATSGKVVQIWPDVGGFAVIIQPNNMKGYFYYGHMRVALVKIGQTVQKGAPIGIMGAANGVFHVHFEYNLDIRSIGAAHSQDIDPSSMFQKSGTLVQNQRIVPTKDRVPRKE